MIPRYSRPEMVAIWTQENKYRIWRDIEVYAAEAMAEEGIIPKASLKVIQSKTPKSFSAKDVAEIDDIEKVTKHDVIAFLTFVERFVGKEGRFLHQGMTSSDVLDTALAVQLKQASDILIKGIEDLLAALKKRAFETKHVMCIGRSHGIHAEPVTFGIKFARFYAEFSRNLVRLKAAREDISTCAISGAVGTFANVPPVIEEYVAKKLGLKPEPVSTQVIPRDRHAMYFATLGVIAASIENVAIEIRHLQRTEVLEAEEFFSKGQKGSSAMPHKRNPVLSENITGLARVVRGYVTPALENVALWHERDISHSSVERMMAPDVTVTLDFAINRLKNIIENLVIYDDNAQQNLDKLHGLIYSQRVLLALTQQGVSREDAYQLVQRNAMKVWQERAPFVELLKKDKDVTRHLPAKELEALFDIRYHRRYIDTLFKRVFGAK